MKNYLHKTLIAFILLAQNLFTFAYDFEVDGLCYNKLSNNQVEITYKSYEGGSYSGTLVIPSKVTYNGVTYDVTSIGNNAFFSCTGLTGSLSIPNSITSIGKNAFYECSGLSSITIPNSVTSIENYAFYGCSGLIDIISEMQNPVDISESVFSSRTYSKATLTVPPGTKTKYQQTNYWNKFTYIEEKGSTNPEQHFDATYTLYSTLQVIERNSHAIDFIRDVDLNDLVIMAQVPKFYSDLVPNPDAVVQIVNAYNWANVVGRGHFEEYPTFAEDYPQYASDGYKGIILVMDEPVAAGALQNSPDTYSYHIPEAAWGDANFKKYLEDPNSIKKKDCIVNPEVYSPHFLVNNNKATPPRTYTLSVTASGNGYASYKGIDIRNNTYSYTVNEGTSATVSITPDNGYSIMSVRENDSDVTSHVSNNKYTINNISSHTTLKVEFKAIYSPTYKLSITASGNGYASFNSTTVRGTTKSFTVSEGTSATITFTPDNGYRLKNVIVNSIDVTSNVSSNSYTVSNISRNTTVNVEFQANPDEISPSDFSSSGSGSQTDPYVISTNTHWLNLAKAVRNGNDFKNINFVLSNDISFTGLDYIPIGSLEKPFSGIIDGKNKTLSNIKLGGDYVGVFGYIDRAKIANLIITSISQEGSSKYIGGFAGYTKSSYINNISTDGRFTGENNQYVGGVIGYADGTTEILNCKNTIRVMGSNFVGGIVGYLSNGCSLTNCYNKYSMYNYGMAGGVAGFNNGSITNCYVTSTMNGQQNEVGGIVGGNDSNGTIKYCYYMKQSPVNSNIDYYGAYNRGTIQGCGSFDSYGTISGNSYNSQTTLSSALSTWVKFNQTTDLLYRQFQSNQSWPDFLDGYYYPLVPQVYELIITASAGGTVIYSNTAIENAERKFTIEEGTSVALSFNPNNGYAISSVIINEMDVTSKLSANQYTISNISGNIKVVATFQEDVKALTVDGVNYTVVSQADRTVKVTGGDFGQVLTVPATVTQNGKTWTVTGIDANALKNNTELAAVIWNPTYNFTATVSNPNLLLYVKAEQYAPSSIQNVVVNGTASNIVLAEAQEGNNFYCPQAFVAQKISYTHNYQMQTGVGESKGWETIALPFDVQTITHETKGTIVPFAQWNNDSNKNPFWLMELTGTGFVEAGSIKAYTPYIISMPNNPQYDNQWLLKGKVTFAASSVTVGKTENLNQSVFNGRTFIPCFAGEKADEGFYALNVSNDWETNNSGMTEGSKFVLNMRRIHPFEAYMTSSSNAAPYFDVFDDTTTGIQVMDEGRWMKEEAVYDLQGRKVENPSKKGVYIVNGKKMIIK